MTHNDKDTKLYDKAEELIERKPVFAEGETYGEVTESETEATSSDSDDTFNHAHELIERKPVFGEGETWGEEPIPESPEQHLPDAPIFSDDEPNEDTVPEDHEHDHPAEQIGLMPLNRINHPLR